MKGINLRIDPKHLRLVKRQQWTGAKDDHQVRTLKELILDPQLLTFPALFTMGCDSRFTVAAPLLMQQPQRVV